MKIPPNGRRSRIFSWLGMRDDYRTLIGVDDLGISDACEEDEDD